MSFSNILILAIYLFNIAINFSKLIEIIRIMICFLKELLCYRTKVWTDFGRVRVRIEIGQ